MADVVAIVVNYGTADLALQAVASLLEAPERLRGIHLVDNASPGGDGAVLARELVLRGWEDRVTLHAERVNHGFGRGNNLVIDRLLAEERQGKVFLLNPDARVEDGALTRLAAFLDDHPQVGAVGARIAKPGADGTPCPVTAAFRFPSALSVFCDAVNFGPLTRLCKGWAVALPAGMASGPVDWVAGAAVMFRLEALAEVGSFDPDFFLYFEEVELMHRLARGGWQTWYLAHAAAIHVEGAATGVKSNIGPRRRPAYWYNSWAHYMVKTRGWSGALGMALLWLAGSGLNLVISALRGRRSSLAPHFLADVTAHVLRPILKRKIPS